MNKEETILTSQNFDIAIIGMAGRFPGANSVEQFWQNIRNGVESITFFSDQELMTRVNPATLQDPLYVKAGAVLDDIKGFDAAFFGYTPREAELMDPQQRFFLECAWEAFEHAGYHTEMFAGSIGVYAGSSLSSYLLLNIAPAMAEAVESLHALPALIGNSSSSLTTRTSYKLNLRGPSVFVQTACSTSLVAVHLACQDLLNYRCDMALAGGVSINVEQDKGYRYEGGTLSPDGHCRAFDARAQGTLNGNGVGCVVLKRLEDALADGDTIHAIIKGSAVNNDGSAKVGFTAPSITGQTAVIREALAIANVDPATIGYIEAHGTGTPLGDPIEVAALTQAYRASTDQVGFCALGSVKTNIGHLDAAAGIAGLIKTVLSLKQKELPPSLHFEQPNPEIDFAHSPFYVNTTPRPWVANGNHPRRAGVSSFGFGGTNVHLILEEAPPLPASEEEDPPHLLLLSAKTPGALEAVTSRLAAALEGSASTTPLADIAYTLQVGRAFHPHRRIVVGDDRSSVVEALKAPDASSVRSAVLPDGNTPLLAWIFPGQGVQEAGDSLGLYCREALFRESVDRCAEILLPHLQGLDIRHLLYPELFSSKLTAPGNRQVSSEWPGPADLAEPWLAQPALFVVEYALGLFWQQVVGSHQGSQHYPLRDASGKTIAALGHSLGEYVVATLAGVLSLEDALKLVAARGYLMQSLPEGSMFAVPLGEQATKALLANIAQELPEIAAGISLAASNAPDQCVLSGSISAIHTLEKWIARKRPDITPHYRRLTTKRAFHSKEMEPMLSPFARVLESLHWKAPLTPYISSVTGEWITAEQATNVDYWVQQVCQPVRFAQAMETLLGADGEQRQVVIEVGPGQTLSSLARRQRGYQSERHTILASMPKVRGNASTISPEEQVKERAWVEEKALLWALGNCWLQGATIDWSARSKQKRRQRVPLPTYPFEHQSFWFTPATHGAVAAGTRNTSVFKEEEHYVGQRSWKRSTLAFRAREYDGQERKRWLLFVDDHEVSQHLATFLEKGGHELWLVEKGATFKRSSDRVYQVNAHQVSDYSLLMNDLRAHGNSPDAILYLWDIVSPASVSVSTPIENVRSASLLNIVFLAQALLRNETEIQRHFWVVTNGAYGVSGDEVISPGLASVLAICRYLSLHSSAILCHQLDMCFSRSETSSSFTLAQQILREVVTEAEDEVIAYRHGYRWVPTTDYTDYADISGELAALPGQSGTHLIFGGLESTGFELTTYLAYATRGKFLLVDNARLPERSEWSSWLAGDFSQREETLIQRIKEEQHARLSAFLEQEDGYLKALEEQCIARFQVERFADELEQTMNDMCTSYICGYLTENGIQVRAGQVYDYSQLREHLRIQPKFLKFFDFFIFCLVEDGIADFDGQKITFLSKANQVEPAASMKARLIAQYPDFAAELNVLEHCATHYSQALSGEIEAIKVLFPDGTMGMLRPIAEKRISLTHAQIYLSMTAEFLAHLVSKNPQKVMRILEVGGGEGFLTWQVMEKLKGLPVEYTFTDLGKSFVLNAEKRARREGYDSMHFGVLDISRPPQEQGYEEYAYDIILAYDVVHATADIEQTVKNMQRWLAPGGMMFFLEASRARRWSSMVWGLAEGWWYFEDVHLRKHSPFLPPNKWQEVLESLHFRCVRTYPHTEEQQLLSDRALLIMQQPEDIGSDDYQQWLKEKVKAVYEEISFKLQQAQVLERLGASVEFVPLEIVDQEQIRQDLNLLRQQFGPLASIIYASLPKIEHSQDTDALSESYWQSIFSHMHQLSVLNGGLQTQEPVPGLLLSPTSPPFGKKQVMYTALETFSESFTSAASREGAANWISLSWLQLPQEEQARQWCVLLAEAGHELLQELLQPGVQFWRWVRSLVTSGTSAHIFLSPYSLPRHPELTHEHIVKRVHASADAMKQRQGKASGQNTRFTNEMQRVIANMWEDITGVRQLEMQSNFFEIGGDSLLATQLISRVRDIYQVEIPLRDFFEQPTIEALSNLVEVALHQQKERGPSESIQPISRESRRVKRSQL
jgi:acyl transferase domain-containing protein/2-polyprenyl-3-methyl-5-hydroxy-6-metoxy-1,4-benzoquinol methylase/acyl carrier protein